MQTHVLGTEIRGVENSFVYKRSKTWKLTSFRKWKISLAKENKRRQSQTREKNRWNKVFFAHLPNKLKAIVGHINLAVEEWTCTN